MAKRLCEGKVCYSKKEAERVKGEIGRNLGKDQRVYKCPTCFMHHLTKKKHDSY